MPAWKFEVVPRVENMVTGVNQVRAALPACWFDEDRCTDGLSALENYRREFDDRLGGL